MSLTNYFTYLIKKVEESDNIGNAGKDVVIAAWNAVVNEVPPEWLKLNPVEKKELFAILNSDPVSKS